MTQATTFGMQTTGPATPDAVAVRINDSLQQLLSTQKGSAIPAVRPGGMLWINDAVTPWVLYCFDGQQSIALMDINPTSDVARLLAGRKAYGRMIKDADQVITAATYTKIGFNTVTLDPDGIVSNSKFTPPTGVYRLSAQVYFAAANMVAGAQMNLGIYKNGAPYAFYLGRVQSVAAQSISLTCIAAASGSDYFEVYGRSDGTGDKTVLASAQSSFFELEPL